MAAILRTAQLLILAFLGAAALFAWHGGGVELESPWLWGAAVLLLLSIELARIGLRRLLAFPADEYGPLPDDEGRFDRHLAKVELIDRNLVRRWKVQRKLRDCVGKALGADTLARAEGHVARADQVLEKWRSMRTPRGEKKRLERRLAEDKKEVCTAKYENAARAQCERAESLKTDRGRLNGRAKAAEIVREGLGDPQADSARLASAARALGLGADLAQDPGAPEPAPPAAERARWVPLGTPVEVAGRTIPGGVYVGALLPAIDGEGRDPALIDPDLPVSAAQKDSLSHSTVGPGDVAYSDFSPRGRAGYLEWSSAGRRARVAPRGWVLAFLAGLERRVLIDAEGDETVQGELPAIHAELERLAATSAADRAMRATLTGLADYLVLRFPRALRALLDAPPQLDPVVSPRVPARLALVLARHAAAARPLEPAFARAWLHASAAGKLRAAARRAPVEFELLFRTRYLERLAPGLVPQPSAQPLRTTYRPKTASLRGRSFTADPGLNEVRADSLVALETLADDCAGELAALSRFSAKSPGVAPDLATLATLPAVLLDARDDPALESLRAVLASVERGEPFVAAQRLLDLWPCKRPAQPTKTDCARFARLLSRLGWGVEPDVRFDGPVWRAGGELVLFPLPAEAQATPSRAYSAASAVLSLACAVSSIDGSVAGSEEAGLREHLAGALGLDAGERERLGRHLEWLARNPPTLSGLERRLEPLDGEQRGRLARFLLEIACADGVVSPGEVRVLERAYVALGLEAGAVHADLHALRSGGRQDGQGGRAGTGSGTGAERVGLDPDLLAAKLRETAAVSGLLREVFAGEGAGEGEGEGAGEGEGGRVYAGLDALHSAFLDVLAGRGEWGREEVEEAAGGLGLLLEGALDTLNDAAFETLGDPLWEGDDEIEVDVELAREWTGLVEADPSPQSA